MAFLRSFILNITIAFAVCLSYVQGFEHLNIVASDRGSKRPNFDTTQKSNLTGQQIARNRRSKKNAGKCAARIQRINSSPDLFDAEKLPEKFIVKPSTPGVQAEDPHVEEQHSTDILKLEIFNIADCDEETDKATPSDAEQAFDSFWFENVAPSDAEQAIDSFWFENVAPSDAEQAIDSKSFADKRYLFDLYNESEPEKFSEAEPNTSCERFNIACCDEQTDNISSHSAGETSTTAGSDATRREVLSGEEQAANTEHHTGESRPASLGIHIEFMKANCVEQRTM